MKVVYVAGPFTAATTWAIEQNIRRAEEAGMYVAECGAMPLIPHANTRYSHGLKDSQFWYDGTLELLRRSDAILLIPGWSQSLGAREEHEEAKRLGLDIFFYADCKGMGATPEVDFSDWCNA